jgi:hypothetical protein
MDKLVSWQTFATASIAVTYAALLSVMGQKSAALLSAVPAFLSVAMLFCFRVRAAFTPLVTAVVLGLLTAFALPAGGAIAGWTAGLLALAVIMVSSFVSGLVGNLHFWAVFSSYTVQATVVCGLLLYYVV